MSRSHFLFNIDTIVDSRGSLSIIEDKSDLPFDIKRIYYLHNISSHESRGGHGHKNLEQIFIPMHGSFNIEIFDGKDSFEYILSNKMEGLYVGKRLWRNLYNFSVDAVCLVLASEKYDEKDYWRNYKDYINEVKK